ncbi:MAG: hypothetical protein Unbinned6224contig1001_22 [Prokaryotic dsDNA virus sp.]|nr:MAG: hypothetical protein Unbinned6224contig1001_22 [Prokaryotic dsDNA virus sp.]
MGRKANGQVKKSKSRDSRSEVLVERLDVKTGLWKKVKINNPEQYLDDDPAVQEAMIDIVASMTDIIIQEKNINTLN